MKILLDTKTFLRILTNDSGLSDRSKQLFRDPSNTIYLSSVSTLELSIKVSAGILTLPQPTMRFITEARKRHGIKALPLDEEASLSLDRLPKVHDDLFDRLLVCQAVRHGLVLLTDDATMQRYPVRTMW